MFLNSLDIGIQSGGMGGERGGGKYNTPRSVFPS